MRQIRKGKALRPLAAAGLVVAAMLVSALPSAGLTSQPLPGAIRMSKVIFRSTRGVACAYRNEKWTAGTRINRAWFISFRQQSKNYTNQARKSRGATREKLQRLAGSFALKALNQQPRCSRLKPPVTSTPSGNASTLPATTSTVAVTASTSPTLPESSTNSSTTTTTIDPDSLAFPADCPTQIEKAWEVRNGVGAGELVQALACGESRPMVATGAPIKVAVLNPEGPVVNFPEFFAGLEAGVRYINEKLGGVGANYSSHVPGRPVELTKCGFNVLVPSELTTCANSIVTNASDIVLTTLAFSGSHRPILSSAGIKELVGIPIAYDDHTNAAVRTLVGPGCLPVTVAMVDYATKVLNASSLSVAPTWSASTLQCYDNGAVIASNVLTGSSSGNSQKRGSLPDFRQTGVKIVAGKTDYSDEVTVLQSSGADVFAINTLPSTCAAILRKLVEVGWSNSSRHAILNGDCYDPTVLAELGSAVEGVTFLATEELTPESDRGTLLAKEIELRRKYKAQFVSNPDYIDLGFTQTGFDFAVRFWQAAKTAVQQGAFTDDAVFDAIDSFNNHVAFGGGRLSCAAAPYASTCSHYIKPFRWQSGKLISSLPLFSGMNLLDGTPGYELSNSPERRLLN